MPPREATVARLGIDVGGTFVDLVLEDGNGGLFFEKVLAEPEDLVGAITSGVSAVLAQAHVPPGSVSEVVHATTRGSNTVLERTGPTTAFLATRGFRDILQIQRALRWSMYDVQLDKPRPLVERSLSFEVSERTLADGSILVPLDEEELRSVAGKIRASGAQAVAVTFLHSYANPDHERRAAAVLASELPGMVITISSDVSLQAREYERANTAVVNSYIATAVSEYLQELVERLPSVGIDVPVWIMQSSGGLASMDQVLERPVRTLESGPAAGVVGAARFGTLLGYPDVLSFDMGGTTAKAAVVNGGMPATTSYFELQRVGNRRGSGLPVDIAALDLVEIGTGGGSIAEVREGTLRVGPRSAGANPGPACYGRGGGAPTVTDANLLLGYCDPSAFSGGITLDVEAAAAAVDGLAASLGIDRLRAAWGIHEVATLDMEHAIRLVSINRGFDPRTLALVCLGGGGPVHGPRLARALGVKVAVVPLAASGGSARGLLEASVSMELHRTFLLRLDDDEATVRCKAILAELVEEASSSSFRSGEDVRVVCTLGMRYVGQGHELLVPVDVEQADAVRIAEQFEERYEHAYGYAERGHPVEVVTWHVALVKRRTERTTPSQGASQAGTAAPARRTVYYPETGLIDVDVHQRSSLRPGDVVVGPCLVAEMTTTTVVLPGDEVEVASDGSLLVHVLGNK
jgi:N-methylhydantoinase A